ncbi:GAF domain-containing protein [Nocardia sp. CDC160]|uniref:GAF domain-containing protein n=1 Tax=Nocardia sp. CDC160 TaxID=3112166 RepID=UPI002DC05B66|nr:GAF domain-containing protein [Nocardia sp. CDC160]MEC3919292.1 GAF domain-containing protein [Nocardia sp. CDC160]
MVETLISPDRPTVVLDGPEPREFSKLTRTSVTGNGILAGKMGPLVRDCAASGQPHRKVVTLPDGCEKRMVAVPVLGPSGHVHAASVWVGSKNDDLPAIPKVGAIEWSPSGIVTTTPAAHYLLQLPPGEPPNGHTIPELLSRFDYWGDRASFLSMFNLAHPTDRWIGTATTTYDDGIDHHLCIAARASGPRMSRTIRAIVFEVVANDSTPEPDPCALAFRQIPVPAGHALALADLWSGFVHEWLAEEHTPLAGWRHHQPDLDDDSRLLAASTCFELATGQQTEANTPARVRFSPEGQWIALNAKWTRIRGRGRPQALIDIAPSSTDPVSFIRGCQICYDLSRPQPDH